MSKIVYLENSKNFQFGKLQKNLIWEIRKICNFENFKNFQFGIIKIFISENSKYFSNFTISKITKFLKFSNLENY